MARFKLVHVGVAVAVGIGAAASTALVIEARAESRNVASSFVPIVPCRLADTRPGSDHVGERSSAIGAEESVTFAVWGSHGNCIIPSTATGIATNVTAVNPTARSFLTVYPSDAQRPLTSNLNWTPSSSPTPNQVTIALSDAGAVSAFNMNGRIDVIIDIVGYYEPATSGPAGPQGPPGDPGVISGTKDILVTEWSASTSTLWMAYTSSTSTGWPARSATILVPELTQEILDGGTIEVRFRPDAAAAAWAPLPHTQPSGSCWNRQVEYRAAVGRIDVYFLHTLTQTDATMPSVSAATLPPMSVQWTIRPG